MANDKHNEAPNITETGKWFGYHLQKDWHILRTAPLACIAIFMLSLVAAWLFVWQGVVPEKNEQIATIQRIVEEKQVINDRKDATIKAVENERDRAVRDAEKARAEIASYHAEHADSSFSLKKRTFILATQIAAFAAKVEKFPLDGAAQINEFQNRFEPRISVTVAEMDTVGVHSDKVLSLMTKGFALPPPEICRELADELTKLAKELPDSP